ncbi:MAG TPA: hypothetical protein VNE42_03810 [Acidimicrobiales bacterium]|nr:hypothetical protein [Acidimicrobiales bacterium]
MPLQFTVAGLAPDHRTGVDEREHVVAFVDEKLKTTDPPVDGRLLVLIDRVAVGGGIVVHTVLCSTMEKTRRTFTGTF